MRLVTLNTWKGDGVYAKRLDLMAEGLAALDADVILLQEVLAAPTLRLHTGEHLAAALGMAHLHQPARAKRRAVEGVEADTTSGLSILTRLPVTAHRRIALPSHPMDGERIAQCAELTTKRGALRVVNVHLTHLTGRDDLRHDQIRALLTAEGDAPLVVGGDFNCGAAALNGFGLTDVRSIIGAPLQPTLIGTEACLDHFMVSERGPWRPARLAVALAETDHTGVSASDHAALVLDLQAQR